MYRPLFGVETEYALSVTNVRGARLHQDTVLDRLLMRASRELPHLRDGGRGMFLANGARFYVDCGGHPEVTTPECGNPWDVVRYVRAGETLLLRLINGERRGRCASQLRVFRTNVDYSLPIGAAWGTHENYLHHVAPDELARQVIPHLVSRLVYTGAGGFRNTSPAFEFTLSPRSAHIVCEISADSTSHRGIFHDKREALANGDHRRLHILCGESLGSDLATWLRTATTALVVALCEAGVRPGDAMTLRYPVQAMHAFASDPTCRVTAERAEGTPVTAIDIQRHYLTLAEAYAGQAFMPPWAEEACRRWRAILGRAENGWESLATTLDWAIKLALYRDHARRRGIEWESLPVWTPAIDGLATALARSGQGDRPLTADGVLGPASPIAADLPRLRAFATRKGLDWDQLGTVLDLRNQLFEIDTRFAQLGPNGIFTDLDSAGALDHRLVGADDVATAIEHPPDVPRARLRGNLVRELSGHAGRYHCGWQGVWNTEDNTYVDLGDPFVAEREWKPLPAGQRGALPLELFRIVDSQLERVRDAESPPPTNPIALNHVALSLRRHDQLDEAERLLRQAIVVEDATVVPDSPKRPHRRNNLALVLLRAGNLAEATDLNVAAWRLKAGQHDLTSGRILFTRVALRLLNRDRDVGLYLGQLKTLLADPALQCHGGIEAIWEIPDVVATLCARLGAEDGDLLTDLAEVLNDRRHLPVLDTYEPWATARPAALEEPWPDR